MCLCFSHKMKEMLAYGSKLWSKWNGKSPFHTNRIDYYDKENTRPYGREKKKAKWKELMFPQYKMVFLTLVMFHLMCNAALILTLPPINEYNLFCCCCLIHKISLKWRKNMHAFVRTTNSSSAQRFSCTSFFFSLASAHVNFSPKQKYKCKIKITSARDKM